MKKNGFSRRDFLKTGALGSLVAGTGLVACTNGRSPSRSKFGDAKNVIFLVSDGMSSGTLTLAELVKQSQFGEQTHWMSLYESDRPYHRGLMDMASLDSTVTDSAAAASSWGSGKRVNNYSLNLSPDGEAYKTAAELFRDAGKATGLVTTTRITHATPAGFSSNVEVRGMEDDIALQYSERGYDVLLGGGLRNFTAESRSDGKDLLAVFEEKGYSVCKKKSELLNDSGNKPILGVFANSHLPYSADQKSDTDLTENVPTLKEMTEQALKRLEKNQNGYFLMVEGGRVDHAAHGNDVAGLIYDQLAFDDVVGLILDYTKNRNDTLVILTTDHGNANPGLLGLGSRYLDSDGLLSSVQNYRNTYDWVYSQLGYHWSMDKLETVRANQVRELLEQATNTVITSEEAQMITDSFHGKLRTPFKNRQRPGAVISGVMANYNSVYFMGTNHTADFIELAAWGPGHDKLQGLTRNTDLFDLYTKMAGVSELV